MSLIYKVIITGIITAFLNAVVKKNNPEYGIAISITSAIIIFSFISESFSGAFDGIKNVMRETGIEPGYVSIILKITGIAYLSEYTGAVLTDAGESAVAKKIELAGKVIIFVMTIPVLETLLKLILSLV